MQKAIDFLVINLNGAQEKLARTSMLGVQSPVAQTERKLKSISRNDAERNHFRDVRSPRQILLREMAYDVDSDLVVFEVRQMKKSERTLVQICHNIAVNSRLIYPHDDPESPEDMRDSRKNEDPFPRYTDGFPPERHI